MVNSLSTNLHERVVAAVCKGICILPERKRRPDLSI